MSLLLSLVELLDFGSRLSTLFRAERLQMKFFLFLRGLKEASHYPK